MDDLKLYAASDEHLNRLIHIVHTFSNDIHMEFGLDKCAKCSIEAGSKVASWLAKVHIAAVKLYINKP